MRINQKISMYISILNISILLLKKGVYPYEDMDNWQDFMKPHYHLKKLFTAN